MMAKTLSSNTLTYVNKYKSVNIHFYISSRATLKETFTAIKDCVLPGTSLVRPKSEIYIPKRDDEHPSSFYMALSPGFTVECLGSTNQRTSTSLEKGVELDVHQNQSFC